MYLWCDDKILWLGNFIVSVIYWIFILYDEL